MTDKHIFIDTNILLYAHDNNAGHKQIIASKKLEKLWNNPYPPAISVQVLQEFYVNLNKRKVANQLAWEIIQNYLCWEVIENTVSILTEAVSIQKRYQLSFWDASIIAAAKHAKAQELWSEDLSNGQVYDGMLVVNPLK